MSYPHRNGVFVGAYVPDYLRDWLREKGKASFRGVSQELIKLLHEAYFRDEEWQAAQAKQKIGKAERDRA